MGSWCLWSSVLAFRPVVITHFSAVVYTLHDFWWISWQVGCCHSDLCHLFDLSRIIVVFKCFVPNATSILPSTLDQKFTASFKLLLWDHIWAVLSWHRLLCTRCSICGLALEKLNDSWYPCFQMSCLSFMLIWDHACTNITMNIMTCVIHAWQFLYYKPLVMTDNHLCTGF